MKPAELRALVRARRLIPAVNAAAAVSTAFAVAGCGGRGGALSLPDRVTFARHVAPIVHANCVDCHRPGGSAPFSLLRYEQVKSYGPAIRAAVESRRMPPWLPAAEGGPFVGERRLSERDVALISRWVEQGMPRGAPAEAPEPPEVDGGWPLGQPDLVAAMPRAYRAPAAARDVFRNFVIPLPVEGRRYVRAVDLDPGNPHLVHHAVLTIDRSGDARRLDALDPEPGYDGMFGGAETESPDGFFLGWTPGRVPDPGRDDLAWRLDPGTDLVLQLHLRPLGEADSVRARVGLYFADREPARYAYMLTLGARTMDIPPGESSYRVRDTYRLPVPVAVLSVYPHAHYLGKEFRALAELPDGSTRWLLRIPAWDFNWQDAYRYVDPVPLPAGAVLVMEWTFDNSAGNPNNPSRPPRRVVYGPASTDEMANAFIRVLPADSSARARLDRDFSREFLVEQIEGLRFRLTIDPSDAATHNRLGVALSAVGRHEEAIAHYREAVRLSPELAAAHYNLGAALQDLERHGEAAAAYRRAIALTPDDARPHYNLGIVLQAEGRLREAADAYRAALRVRPDHARAANNLGNVLRELGRVEEAEQAYRRAIASDSLHADARNNLGTVLRSRGDLDGALGQYRVAVRSDPQHVLARLNLGATLEERRAYREAAVEYREAVRLAPDWPVPRLRLAWLIATVPDTGVGRPEEAVELAERALLLMGEAQPAVLDVLAAAHASAREFARAAAVGGEALRLARAAGQTAMAEQVAARLSLYRQGRRYVRPD